MGQGQKQADAPSVTAPTPFKSGCLGTLLIILLVSCVLDFYFFTGYFSSDDRTYFASGKALAELGGYSDLSLGAQRLPVVGWVALVILIAGPHFQIVSGSFIFFHQLINVLIFLLIKRKADSRAALLAAFVLATFPLLITYSTVLLPDLEQACGYLLAFLFYSIWSDNRESRPALAWLAFCSSGAAVGISYMAKEAALVLLPFFFVAWLTTFKRSRVMFWLVQGSAFAVGFFAMLYGEYLVLSHFAGEPFVRLGWTTKDVEGSVMASVNKYGTNPLVRLRWVWHRLDNYAWPHYLKLPMGLAMLCFPLLKPRRWALWLLPIWVFSFQVWGTMNFHRYLPPTIQARYFIVIVPFVTAVFAIAALRAYDAISLRLSNEQQRVRFRRIALAATIIPPLFGLYGPDRLAGKLYKSDIVANTTAAIRQVEHVDPGARIVLSTTLANFIQPLAGEDNLPYATARELSGERLGELVEAGSFYYIELAPEHMPGDRSSFRDSRLDACLRNTADLQINPLGKALTEKDVVYRTALSPGGQSYIDYDGWSYKVVAHATNRCDRPHSRTWRMLSEHAAMLPPAAPILDVNSRTTVTYLVEIRQELNRPVSSERRLVHDLGRSMNAVENESAQNCLTYWGVSGNVNKHQFERHAAGWKLYSLTSMNDSIWFMPRRRRVSPADFALGMLGRYEMVIDLAIEGRMQIEIDLECADLDRSNGGAKPTSRAWLHNGRNVLGLYVDERPVGLRPCFKLIGPGSFSVKSCKIYQVD